MPASVYTAPPDGAGGPPVPGDSESQGAQVGSAPPAPVSAKVSRKKTNDKEQAAESLGYEEAYIELSDVTSRFPISGINEGDPRQSTGLANEQVLEQREKFGKNELSPPKKDPPIVLFLKQFLDLFRVLLMIAGILSLISYFTDPEVELNLYLAIILIAIVIINCVMAFMEEMSSGKVMDSFKNMLPPKCSVIRGGKSLEIAAQDLVVGDLVWVKNGEKVPADMRLVQCNSLKVECSSLTGESEPIRCTEREVRPLECTNIVFNGSLCHDGAALGLVLTVGDSTVIGRIAKMASTTKPRMTTMEREVGAFVRFITVLALSMSTVFFLIGLIRQEGKDALNLFVAGFLVVFVANVPQGLPATVTSLLAIAARKLGAQKVLVKRLDCVETLGSMTLVATDKTGTLTKNVMTVTDLWYAKEFVRHHADSVNYYTDATIDFIRGKTPHAVLYRCACICNRSEMIQPGEIQQSLTGSRHAVKRNSFSGRVDSQRTNSWRKQQEILNRQYTGNASDIALMRFCETHFSVDSARDHFPIVFEVPFNSTNKWQLVIVRALEEGKLTPAKDKEEYDMLFKGAPEVVIKRCNRFLTVDGTPEPIDNQFRADFMKAYETFGENGRRVLALATTRFTKESPEEFDAEKQNFPTSDLCFVGLVAIMDPPRDDVPEAISTCHDAGVKVFMVTGDHPLTGKAIARQIGLVPEDATVLELVDPEVPDSVPSAWHEKEAAVIHGGVIDSLQPAHWECILSKQSIVFARTTPQHKLEIVRQCQARGEVVAVTGDGVNDAPALKQADVGVAMGKNGSEVAREAADIVLMEDTFSSIVLGIKQGRTIFDNLIKTIAYTLAHLLPEICPVLLNLALGLPTGLSSLQILSIDLGTELCPAISLAYEKPEEGVMDRPPRDPAKDRLVSKSLLIYSYLVAGVVEVAGCFLA